jgi:hypothetical protein
MFQSCWLSIQLLQKRENKTFEHFVRYPAQNSVAILKIGSYHKPFNMYGVLETWIIGFIEEKYG